MVHTYQSRGEALSIGHCTEDLFPSCHRRQPAGCCRKQACCPTDEIMPLTTNQEVEVAVEAPPVAQEVALELNPAESQAVWNKVYRSRTACQAAAVTASACSVACFQTNRHAYKKRGGCQSTMRTAGSNASTGQVLVPALVVWCQSTNQNR